MTSLKQSRMHRYARPVILRSSGRWFKWHLKDSLDVIDHPTLITSGLVKGSEACREAARDAARAYNLQYVAPPEPKVERWQIQPTCSKAGEFTEAFRR